MATTGLSMSLEDQGKIDPEINVRVSEQCYPIGRADEKIIDLVRKNGKTGEDETNKAFRADIEFLKKDQGSVKKRVNEFRTSRSYRLEDCNNLDSLTSLTEDCKAFKVNRSTEMSLRFDKTNDKHVLKSGCKKQGEELKVKTAGVKKDKNHVKKWFNQSDSDIEYSFSFAEWKKTIPTLSSDSDSEDSEVEEEIEEFKQKRDLKERLLAKLIEFDSVDDLEDEFWEEGEELRKEDTVRANMVESKWMNYLQLDGFDVEFYTNIDGLKEDMSAMMFQDGKYKKFKHNEKNSS